MVSNVKKTILVIATVLLSACTTGQKQDHTNASANSVKVTNAAGTHGGTGSVLYSGDKASLVLTNSHVCAVVETGGLVNGRYGSFMVAGYKRSTQHDLCLIKVFGNLRTSAKIATRAPIAYDETALISGHPSLYPNVKTYGHFSGRQPIDVMTGYRKCTEEDAQNPETGLYCALLGQMPIIVKYDAVLVTATISPGSSGSAVYNKDLEIAGVAFAGQGELNYAWTVPYEYVKNFIYNEVRNLEWKKPDNALGAESKKAETEKIEKRIEEVCSSSDRSKVKRICDLFQSRMIY